MGFNFVWKIMKNNQVPDHKFFNRSFIRTDGIKVHYRLLLIDNEWLVAIKETGIGIPDYINNIILFPLEVAERKIKMELEFGSQLEK